MQTNQNHKIKGHLAEKDAALFLQKKGLRFIEKNYHSPYGEIDLIMQDKNEIVFVEVRLRIQDDYGDAIESIDPHKQKKLLETATHFLQQKDWLDKVNCRFDVIGFSNSEIDWIIDAFSYE